MAVAAFVVCVLRQKIAMPMAYVATPAYQTAKTSSAVRTVAVENAVFATRAKIVLPKANVSIPTHANPTAPTLYVVLMDAAAHVGLVHRN